MVRRWYGVVAILLGLVFVPAAGRGAEPSAEPAAGAPVAALLKAYGGAAAVAGIRTVAARGEISDYLTDTAGGYRRYFQRPERLRIEVMPEQGGEVRILDGNRGWQGRGGEFRPAGALLRQSMVYQYSYLDLPMGLADGTYAVRAEGRRRLGDRETELLTIELRDGPRLRVFVDATTHLIIRVAADFAMGMMGSGELATEYHDFRPVAGVLFPHRLVNFAGEMKLSEIVLTAIEVNKEIPADLFSPVAPETGR